jgi:hypothetical protein
MPGAVPDLGAVFRSPVKLRVPTLFISGTLDARTPVSNAEEVRQGFSQSPHLIIEGAAHGDDLFLSSPEVQQVMLEFMKGQKLSTTRITLPTPGFRPYRSEISIPDNAVCPILQILRLRQCLVYDSQASRGCGVGKACSRNRANQDKPAISLLLRRRPKRGFMVEASSRDQAWPALPLEAWADACTTLHMWTQIVGKIRFRASPPVNHGWHSTLYVTSRGLTTSSIPHGLRTFQIDFDFIDHILVIQVSDGGTAQVMLEPQTVAAFYRRLMDTLHTLGIEVRIYARPNEVPDPIPFERDEVHRAYDADYVNRFWRALVQSDRVFKEFRARFIGKCSPVHLFWGALDLAVTRFSGRPAPEHPGGIPNLPDRVTREAYSHEVSSCGFWAGSGIGYPAFYSYSYAEPAGFAQARVRPEQAFYSVDLREFILPYDIVRKAADPDRTLLEFLQSTYEAAADLARWDRAALEKSSRQ